MYEESLQHHGILGQKWGVRRFQNDVHIDEIYNDKHAKYGAGRVAFWLKEG